MEIGFFDLETRNLFEDLEPKYPSMPFREKTKIAQGLISKLGLATACIISDGSKPQTFAFDEGEETKIIEALNSFDLIVGHNVLGFDYPVLSANFNGDIVGHYRPKTLDTFDELKKITNGQWIGLDDLAKLNLGKNKTEDSKKAPAMWREGKKERVREYCKNDVLLLKEIYYYAKEKGKLKYTHKDYGVAKGIKETKIPWK